MKIALYGLPCSGKSFLLEQTEGIEVVKGSQFLSELSDNKFKKLTNTEQESIRIKLTEILEKKQQDFIIDGHYSFGDEIVFTEKDSKLYDVFIYLYTEPSLIYERMKKSQKNKEYLKYDIDKWQNKEIEGLRKSCHLHNKDFYIMDKHIYFFEFLKAIIGGFSNLSMAKEIVKIVLEQSKDFNTINLLDGDKTLTKYDTSRKFLDYKTDIFDNNFYTGFQFWLQGREFEHKEIRSIDLDIVEYNETLLSKVKNQYNVILSGGNELIWNKIAKKVNMPVFAGVNISAETKYFVTKFLKENKKIIAYGDSFSDIFMLREADKGYLVVQDKISRSLKDVNILGVEIMNSSKVYNLEEDNNSDKLKEFIEICKSNSGVSGNKLAEVHIEVGKLLGEEIKKYYCEEDTEIVIIERAGHFIGTGIYLSLNGKLCVINPKSNNNAEIFAKNIVLVDGVINSGKTILEIIEKIKQNANIENIIIATGVIQKKAVEKFKDYKLFTLRISSNEYTGQRQRKQEGDKGPDTADRLFNLI